MNSVGGLNIEAVCYLGLLRCPEQLERALALLQEPVRTEAVTFLTSIKGLSREELSRRWSTLRVEEYSALRQEVQRRCDICIDQIPPSLREQWINWLTGQHE